jgi:membrane peptidoglycan carboxypeptidase
VSDLIAREQEYQEALSNLLSKRRQEKQQTKTGSEFDDVIRETKQQERQEQLKEKER